MYLLGCPYTDLKNIERALRDFSVRPKHILNARDITAIDGSNGIKVGSIYIEKKRIKSAFLRYPYDLISPHSGTYKLREETEFYKSICLLFDSVNANRLGSTWLLRNRMYSLNCLSNYGALIPDFRLCRGSAHIDGDETWAVKAAGNCYVSEVQDEISLKKAKFLTIEQDGTDFAAVFPASEFKAAQVVDYLNTFGTVFMQKSIKGRGEFRCYVIRDQFFIYEREKINRFDKSFANYIPTDYAISENTKLAIRKMIQSFSLSYSCFDMIVDESFQEFIIDFNPYGSFPQYFDFPEPSEAVAREMMRSWIDN